MKEVDEEDCDYHCRGRHLSGLERVKPSEADVTSPESEIVPGQEFRDLWFLSGSARGSLGYTFT